MHEGVFHQTWQAEIVLEIPQKNIVGVEVPSCSAMASNMAP